MKKMCFLGCLLLIIGMTACEKNEEVSVPAPSGQFVYRGEVYDLHYGSIRRNAAYSDCYNVLLYSHDGATRLDLSFYTHQGGIVTGVYQSFDFTVSTLGQQVNARLSLNYVPEEEESSGPNYNVEFEKNAGGGYNLRISLAEDPDVDIINWSGKLS